MDKNILVLDLGAESFNLSLISCHDGLYTIEDSVEVPDLGGASFDKVLYEYAREEFKKKTKMDISDNKRSVAKLLNASEVTKRSLTRQDTAPCFVESLSLISGLKIDSPLNHSSFLKRPLLHNFQFDSFFFNQDISEPMEFIGKAPAAAHLILGKLSFFHLFM